MTGRRRIHCSFCGKRDDEVEVLVAGPTVFICDGCVEICQQVVTEDRAKRRAITIGEAEYRSWQLV